MSTGYALLCVDWYGRNPRCCLTSVFKVMYQTDAETEGRIGGGVEELASATMGQAFLKAELDADGNLTLEEFKQWYTEIPSGPYDRPNL